MDNVEEKKCPEPPYMKYWFLIMITYFLGWFTGSGELQYLLTRLLGGGCA